MPEARPVPCETPPPGAPRLQILPRFIVPIAADVQVAPRVTRIAVSLLTIPSRATPMLVPHQIPEALPIPSLSAPPAVIRVPRQLPGLRPVIVVGDVPLHAGAPVAPPRILEVGEDTLVGRPCLAREEWMTPILAPSPCRT